MIGMALVVVHAHTQFHCAAYSTAYCMNKHTHTTPTLNAHYTHTHAHTYYTYFIDFVLPYVPCVWVCEFTSKLP